MQMSQHSITDGTSGRGHSFGEHVPFQTTLTLD